MLTFLSIQVGGFSQANAEAARLTLQARLTSLAHDYICIFTGPSKSQVKKGIDNIHL